MMFFALSRRKAVLVTYLVVMANDMKMSLNVDNARCATTWTVGRWIMWPTK